MMGEAPWRKRSACRRPGVDPDLFFVSDEDHRTKNLDLTPLEEIAVEVCRRCPVSGNCLKAALEEPGLVGIWGGTTTKMRRALRKVRPRSSCPRCIKGRIMSLDDQITQVCMNCGLSWHRE